MDWKQNTPKPPSSAGILNALRGLRPEYDDPALRDLELLRTMTQWGGSIFPAQVQTLKRNGMLILDVSSLGLLINTETKTCSFRYDLGSRNPRGNLETEEYHKVKVAELVYRVLGPGWSGIIEPYDSRPTRQSRKPAQRKRTRGRKKTGRRR